MKLSIIIVNYNVKYFLEQTLDSIFKSETEYSYQVIVIDNNSSDDSLRMLKERFSQVKVIANKENTGFAKACNQGIRISDSDYILLLNPDTIISNNTIQLCLDRMREDHRIGALGVKMIDGGGHFLPESKRGLPTPRVAFFKAFGLSKLFPRSGYFNRYHLGHIDEDDESEIDVLCGAFMLVPKKVFDEVGLLDERFFMYGEDVDLSYRIQQAGYKVIYFPKTQIVHFKGESTKKGSLNYVRVFYRAMILFAEKHFVEKGGRYMKWIYRSAVWFRASLDLAKELMKRTLPPILDAFIIFIGLKLISQLWATYYFGDPEYFRSSLLNKHLLSYTSVWIMALFIGGAYDRFSSLNKLWKSLLVGTAILLIGFALLRAEWRPSRAIVGLGSIWALTGTAMIRILWRRISTGSFSSKDGPKRMAIVGSEAEIVRAKSLIRKSGSEVEQAWRLSPNQGSKGFDGELGDLNDMVEIHSIDEVIFCSKDVKHEDIMRWMSSLGQKVSIKIIPEDVGGIIGSRYKNRRGELYAVDGSMEIDRPEKRRQKRLFDVLIAAFLLLAFPLVFWMFDSKRKAFHNIIKVLTGKKTWIGYRKTSRSLPNLKDGVVQPSDVYQTMLDDEMRSRVDFIYAKDYSVWIDFDILFKTWRKIGG